MSKSLRDLIDAGLIQPGKNVLTMKYRSTIVYIDLTEDGRLKWKNQIFPSPSNFSLFYKRQFNSRLRGDSGNESIHYDGRSLKSYLEMLEIEEEFLRLLGEHETTCKKAESVLQQISDSPKNITMYHDGRNTRPLCHHNYNEGKTRYGIPCSEHVSDCKCPIHRSETFWRRLANEALTNRKQSIISDPYYLKTVVGLSKQEYHTFLEIRFRETFRGILSQEVLEKNYHQLCEDGFVLDEIYPRCEGKRLKKDPVDIAHFLAKVFNHNNTQLLFRDNNHARRHGIDTNQYKMLINGSKGGIVDDSARVIFDKIQPSEDAVKYMLKFLGNFLERET